MSARGTGRNGQAAADWLVSTALVALLAALGHVLLFAPLRRVFRWVGDCVTLDQCRQFTGFWGP